MLEIRNLSVKVLEKPILNNVSLTFKKGETHAIMGRNGSGKSSLSKVIAGHPDYSVTEGEIIYTDDATGEKINLLEKSPEERLWLGIFVSFQYPIEIPGLLNHSFLKTAYNALMKFKGKPELDSFDFNTLLENKAASLHFNKDFLLRGVNAGFSGGEKKRNEILQLSLLNPSIAFLDEIDSGLDIDALNLVLAQVQSLKSPEKTFVFITHYAKVISLIKPDFVHIMHGGRVLLSTGDAKIANRIETTGFESLIDEYTGNNKISEH